MKKTKVIFIAIILSLSNIVEVISKEKNTDDIVYQKLISELRCMVCQNQNLAESEAPLAIDLKNKVMEMIKDGKSEEYIKNYLSERYSSFILYKPPFVFQNSILWFAPYLFLIIITYLLFRRYLK